MNKLKMRSTLNHSGVVLMSVMIILLVMTIIISGVVFVTMQNLDNSQKAASHTETYYVAEGGINYLSQMIENQSALMTLTTRDPYFTAINSYISTNYPASNKYVVPFTDNNGKTSQALIWITPLAVTNPDVRSYELHSEGYIGSVKRTLTRTVSIEFKLGGIEFRDAIFSKGDMTLGKALVTSTVNGVTVPGSISTNSWKPDSIDFKDGAIVGDVYVPNNLPSGMLPADLLTNPSAISGTIQTQTPPTINPIKIIPIPSPTTTLPKKVYGSGSSKFTLINASGDFMLTRDNSTSDGNTISVLNQPFDLTTYADDTTFSMNRFLVNVNTGTSAPNFSIYVGDNDYTIVTNTLWIHEPLKVTGTGTLTFIVRQNLSSKVFDKDYPIVTSGSKTTNPVPISLTANGIVGAVDTTSSRFKIYVQKITSNNKPIQLPLTTGNYYMSIFADNLSYFLDGATIHGALGTNLDINPTYSAFEIWSSSNSSAILYYAPNGDVSFQSSSIVINGAILCNTLSVKAANSPQINFDSDIDKYALPGVIDITGLSTPPSLTFTKTPTLE